MNSGPYSYEFINAYNSIVSPSTVHVKNTALAQFFKRYLLDEVFSVYEWTMPENWAENYFKVVLYCIGYISVLETDKFGVIPQHCGLGGYNVFYQPRWCIVNNPLFKKTYTPVIGKDCEVIKLQPDWCGIYDLVDYYGDLLALTAETAGVNILNSKLSFVFFSKNKAAAESFKKLYDDIASGNPAAFPDKDLLDDEGRLTMEMFNQNVGQNFIADRLLDVMRTIRNMFLTDIGIPNANTDKKERLITDEVNANNFETRSKASLWLSELKKGCSKVREMFGIDLDVNWAEGLREEVNPDAGIDSGVISLR